MLSTRSAGSCRSPEWIIFWPVLVLPFAFTVICLLLDLTVGMRLAYYPVLSLLLAFLALFYCGRIIYYSPVLAWRKWTFFCSLCLLLMAQLSMAFAVPLLDR